MRSFSFSYSIVCIILLAALGGCNSRYSAPVEQIGDGPRFISDGRQHRVNGGETLYAIAWMYDLDVNALARANQLAQPYTVNPGMMLTVDPRVVDGVAPVSTPGMPSTIAVNESSAGTAVVSAVSSGGGLQRTPLPTVLLPTAELPTDSAPPANTSVATAATTPAATISNTEPVIASTTTPATAAATSGSTATATPASSTTSTATTPATTPAVVSTAPTSTTPAANSGAVGSVANTTATTTATTAATTATAAATTAAATTAATVAIPTPVVATPPSTPPPSNGEIVWNWPYSGRMLAGFADSSVEGKGVDLAGNAGDPILAAADGEVVYSGGGLQRYGNLLIIKHDDHFLSAYAHNRALLVKEGDAVKRGQRIAELGNSGVDRYMLHFEIRQDGKPVDPAQFLPRR